jgi:hypothetical protein
MPTATFRHDNTTVHDSTVLHDSADASFDTNNFGAARNVGMGLIDWGKSVTAMRVLLHFDISSLPQQAVITAATLTMTNAQAGGTIATGSFVCDRLTRGDWVEGTGVDVGNTGGVCWTSYDGTNAWTTAGGDFATTSESNATIGNPSTDNLIFSDANFVALVNDAVSNRARQLHLLLRAADNFVGSGFWFSSDATSGDGAPGVFPTLSLTYSMPPRGGGGFSGGMDDLDFDASG